MSLIILHDIILDDDDDMIIEIIMGKTFPLFLSRFFIHKKIVKGTIFREGDFNEGILY